MNNGTKRQTRGQAGQERIRHACRERHGAALARVAWHRPEVRLQCAHHARVLAAMLAATVGTDLSGLRVLDVGCGNGAFLRQLIDWGAQPARLAGSELQPERIDAARTRTAPGVRWHLGQPDAFDDGAADLVSANMVFSAIPDDDLRRDLAAHMWRILRPGGWALIFDVRHGDPRNPHLRRLTDVELLRFWPAERRLYRSLILAAPLSRALAALPPLVPELLAALVPPLRSHFIYMARKPA